MGWFVIVEKYHSICAGSGDTLQNFVKYGNSQHKVTKMSLLTPTVCQPPERKRATRRKLDNLRLLTCGSYKRATRTRR